MRPDLDDLDRRFLEDDALVPSSGFTARVMDAVCDDAAEPPPLAFPWRPFVIGVLACVVWAASAIQLLTGVDRGVVTEISVPSAGLGRLPLYAAAAVIAVLIVMALQRTVARR